MAFVPRLTSAGILGNLHWYTSQNPYYPEYGMPNCTAYAWGRFWEIGDPLSLGINKPNPNDLPGGWSGGYWWSHFNTDVYESGSTPALGAVACFWDTTGSDGHVAIVEVINDEEGYIITSNSAWSGSFFYTARLYKSEGYNWTGSNGHYYTLQGFIYNPYGDSPIPPEEKAKKRNFPWLLYANKLRSMNVDIFNKLWYNNYNYIIGR